MLRRLAVVAAVCLLPMANAAFALGLGEIKVTSALNQRFEATIPFTSITADEADSIKIRIADNDAFARAGLERAAFLSSLSLEAVTTGGAPHIVIKSNQIAREPLVTMLIEVRAGGPRLLREYSVLLDPPGPESNVSKPFAREEAVPPKTADVIPAPSEFYQAAKEAPMYTPGSSSYGPIRDGDTLWSIGQKVRPTGARLSVEQVMLALYEGNPNGFLNGNPNTLRKGSSLQVPPLDAMRRTDAETAKTKIRGLMASGGTLASAGGAAQPDLPPLSPVVTPVVPNAPSRPSTPPASTTATPASTITAVPATTPETTPSTPSTAPATTPSATAPATSTPSTTPATGTETPPAATAAPPAATGTPSATATATPPPVKPSQAPVKRPEEPSLISKLVPILIGLIVLAIGLVIWRSYREKKATREYEAASRQAATSPMARTGSFTVPQARAVSARDELEAVNRRLAEEDQTRVTDDDRTVVAPEGETSEMDAMTSTSRMPAFTGTQTLPSGPPGGGKSDFDVTSQFEANTLQIDLAANDPIAEADFHLAYGLYEEAALLLRQAAEREPDRTDVRVKLAETYFAAGKPVEFQEVAESVKPNLSSEEWGKLAIMGRQLCPDSALFLKIMDSSDDVAIDLAFDEPERDTQTPSPVAVPKAKVDDGLDFTLEELELPGGGPSASPTAKASSDQPVEFDLGEFDLGGTKITQPAPVTIKTPTAGDLSLKDFDLGDTKLGDKARTGLDIRLEDVSMEAVDDDPLADDVISAGDDVGTKLDLARAYVEMGDAAMARTLLDEVTAQGSDDQKREAEELRERLLG